MYTMQQLLDLKEKEADELRERISALQAKGTLADVDAAELETQKMYLVRAEDQINRFRLRIAGIDPNSNSPMTL